MEFCLLISLVNLVRNFGVGSLLELSTVLHESSVVESSLFCNKRYKKFNEFVEDLSVSEIFDKIFVTSTHTAALPQN